MSMREVAGQSHASTATINRMAHKLGYMNYIEFKCSLDSLEIISCLNGLKEDYYEDSYMRWLLFYMKLIIF